FHTTEAEETEDQQLIESALGGSSAALESLIKRHQHYIYNVALKLALSPVDAEDITQEVLVKMVTRLGQFQGKSSFRTWLYRITFNHFLKMKKRPLESQITTFEQYGEDLDSIPYHDLSEEEQIEQRELIVEAKLGCMSGMILCLSREQRLVYILGELFEVNHNVGAELLEITPANFRKRLERARRDLYQFMTSKCGLINKANPCRCARKTTGFIAAGWVDKQKMRFNTDYVRTIQDTVPQRNTQLDHLLEQDYAALFQDTPFQEKPHADRLLATLFSDPKVRETFNLS
ncbi:MAG TPA: RNA polymerase subunit sigma-70, partial [Cytophagales bacterium]|nr:RNA polymerase subunit sigma-70 [Cytophagales bacterium]